MSTFLQRGYWPTNEHYYQGFHQYSLNSISSTSRTILRSSVHKPLLEG